MKPTREECIEQAVKSAVLNNEYMWLHVAPESLERFALAMYRKGQEDMRKMAAQLLVDAASSNIITWKQASSIPDIPIEGEE